MAFPRRFVAPIRRAQPLTRARIYQPPWRELSTGSLPGDVEPPDYLSEVEQSIFKKIKTELSPTKLEVQDMSGGCGSFYGLDIVSPKFAGLSVIKQHKMVNEILAEEMKGWHGAQLKTRAP